MTVPLGCPAEDTKTPSGNAVPEGVFLLCYNKNRGAVVSGAKRLQYRKDAVMATSVFVCTHVPTAAPKDSAYHLLQVNAEVMGRFGEEYYYDNDGEDNLSRLNEFFGELTGLYWIWRNYPGQENIGICHYRRFFTDDSMIPLSEGDYDRILRTRDVIVPKPKSEPGQTYRQVYAKAHNIHDFEAVGRSVRKLYPQYAEAFHQMAEGHDFYYGNLFVMPRSLYNKYCSFLFEVLFDASGEIHPEEYVDLYHRRVFGFLSENLLMVFLRAEGLSACECPVGVAGDKAESSELFQALSELICQGRRQEAEEMVQKVQRLRPDLTFANSDLHNRLLFATVALALGTADPESSFADSEDLTAMADGCQKVYDCLQAVSDGRDPDGKKAGDCFAALGCTKKTAGFFLEHDPGARLGKSPLDPEKIKAVGGRFL